MAYPLGSGSGSTLGSGSGSGTFASGLSDSGFRIICALSDGSRKGVAEIMQDSGCLPLGDLLYALNVLLSFGLVKKDGEQENQYFALTASGTQVARAMGH